MDDIRDKIVDFEKYCKQCKFYNVNDKEGKEPCNSCLDEPVNENSKKPVNFKEKDKKDKGE
jgi:hypothetical protein